MKIAIANDHGGVELKQAVVKSLEANGYEVINLGVDTLDSVDYPDFAEKVADLVVSGEVERGIVICGTGVGISIAANKIKGIRCALVHDVFTAQATSAHNNTNMLAMGGRVIGPGLAEMIVHTWLETPFEGGRHQTRIDKVTAIENKC